MRIALLLLIAVTGCASTSGPSPVAPQTTVSSARGNGGPATAADGGTFEVSGLAQHVQHHCAGGGAAVPPEVIQRAYRATPLSAPFLVSSGAQIGGPVAARFTSGKDGRFTVRLPPGTWCLYFASRQLRPDEQKPARVRPAPSAPGGEPWVDAQCLAAQRRRCDAEVQVGNTDVANVRVDDVERCPEPFNQPCYRGPMPP